MTEPRRSASPPAAAATAPAAAPPSSSRRGKPPTPTALPSTEPPPGRRRPDSHQQCGRAANRPAVAHRGRPRRRVLGPDSRYRAAVLEIAQPFGLPGGPDPTSDRPAEQRQRCFERRDPALGDLRWLDDHRSQNGVVEDTAVEKETHTAWTTRPGTQEVHAHQPTGGDVEAALFLSLAATSLPGGFAALDYTARDRPTALVRWLQDEQSALPATYQSSGGGWDRRD